MDDDWIKDLTDSDWITASFEDLPPIAMVSSFLGGTLEETGVEEEEAAAAEVKTLEDEADKMGILVKWASGKRCGRL